MPVGLKHLNISPLSVEYMLDLSVPGARTLCQDIEVMAMEMHRMRNRRRIVEHDANGGVGAEVVIIPLWVVWV